MLGLKSRCNPAPEKAQELLQAAKRRRIFAPFSSHVPHFAGFRAASEGARRRPLGSLRGLSHPGAARSTAREHGAAGGLQVTGAVLAAAALRRACRGAAAPRRAERGNTVVLVDSEDPETLAKEAAKLRAEAADLEAEQEELRRKERQALFKILDTDGSGALDAKELQKGVKEMMGSEVDDEQAQGLVQALDINGDGIVQPEELDFNSVQRLLRDFRKEMQTKEEAERTAAFPSKEEELLRKEWEEFLASRPPRNEDTGLPTLRNVPLRRLPTDPAGTRLAGGAGSPCERAAVRHRLSYPLLCHADTGNQPGHPGAAALQPPPGDHAGHFPGLHEPGGGSGAGCCAPVQCPASAGNHRLGQHVDLLGSDRCMRLLDHCQPCWKVPQGPRCHH